MSSIVECKIDYNRNFTKALLALVKNDYKAAKEHLEKATGALSALSALRSGESQKETQLWVLDLVREIDYLELKINHERAKESIMKKLSERASCNGAEGGSEKGVVASDIPETSFDDIAGLDDVKQSVMYKVIYPRMYKELYDKLRKRSGGGILLYGLPGTGKTLIAEAIAHETKAVFFPVKCSDLGSKWFGETEQNIRSIFEKAREAGNAVIFFDEIEAYASNRRENSAMERSIPEFLAQMQGVGESSNKERILVIGATNKPWRLDGAFLRPGRFDEKIYVPLPDHKARRKMLDLRMDGIPMESDIDFDYIVNATEGYNGADIDYLCEKAKEFVIQRVVKNHDPNEIMTKGDFALALSCVKSSVVDIDRHEMEQWISDNK